MRPIVTAALAVAFALTASGCIGATDRADFEAEIRNRGGGVSVDWIDDALAVVAREVGTDPADLQILSMTIETTHQVMSVNARRGDRPDFVDMVTVSGGEVFSTNPVQNADELPLDDIAIDVTDLPIGDIEAMSDAALAEFGEEDGSVASLSVSIVNSQPDIRMQLESARRTGAARFDLDGRLLEVTR